MRMFAGINVKYGARIVLMPSFAMSLEEMKRRLIGGADIKISKDSTLILEGNVVVKKMELNGTLIVRARGDAKIVIDGLVVKNDGWKFVEIEDLDDSKVDAVDKLRGYELVKMEQRIIQFDDDKEHVIS